MTAYRQGPDDPEAGGVLIGRIYQANKQIVVECATRPGKGDVSTRTTFYRDGKRARRLIRLAWLYSNQELNYLGEWHTHPEPKPQPSGPDRRSLLDLQDCSKPYLNGIIVVIIGTKEAYTGFQSNHSLVKLNVRWDETFS